MPAASCDPRQLIEAHQGLVRSLAMSIHRRLPPHVEIDDLLGYGQVGLVEAAHDFDAARGIQFSTFAYYRIRGAMYDGLSKMAWVSRAHYRKVRYEQLADEVLRADAETPLDPNAPAESQLRWLRNLSRALAVVYLATNAEEDEPDRNWLVDSAIGPPAALMKSEMRQKIRQLVGELPLDCRQLIEAMYFEGLTLTEAGRRLGISKSWASRVHTKGLERLARLLKAQAG